MELVSSLSLDNKPPPTITCVLGFVARPTDSLAKQALKAGHYAIVRSTGALIGRDKEHSQGIDI